MLAMKLSAVESTVIEFNGKVLKDLKRVIKGYKKSKIDVYNHLLVEMNEKEEMVVTYVTYDLTIQKTYEVTDAIVKNRTSFVLPISALKEMKYIKNEEMFIIEVREENKILINRDGIESLITTMNREEFMNVNPLLFGKEYEEIETKEEGNNLLNKDDLKVFIKAGKTVSESETRPVLTQIAVINGEAISTDSHRLFKGKTILAEREKTMMLPVNLFSLANNLSDKNDLFTLFIDQDQNVKIQSDKLVIVERLVEGNYPQIDRLIPTYYNLEFKLEKIHQFVTILRSVKNALVKMTYNKDDKQIELLIQNKEKKQEVNTILPIIVEQDHSIKDSFSLNFNAQFMLDAIEQMDKQYLHMKFVSNMRPFIVTNDKNEDMALILPVRTY
jgi:DNA polymerase III subunit beta